MSSSCGTCGCRDSSVRISHPHEASDVSFTPSRAHRRGIHLLRVEPSRGESAMSESVEIVTGGGNRSLEEAWTQAQAGLGYVAWLARDYLYTGVPREDLESEGRLGLLDAAPRFHPAHGAQFTTYASWWARRRMQLFAARHARRVPRPAHRASARPIEWGEGLIAGHAGVGGT